MGSIAGNAPESIEKQVVPLQLQEEVVDNELYQDVVSQFPFLNGYTHVVLSFKVPPTTSRDDIVAALRAGVNKITAQIPWLTGQVIHVPGGPGNSGYYKPAPWPATCPVNDIVRVKDCDDLLPPMDQILRAGTPIGMLDGEVLTPWPGLPQPHGIKGPVPIVALQANFIKGGLLLNMSHHHIILDATSIIQFTRLLITVMNGDEIPAADIEQGNRDRRRVVPLVPRGEPVKDHSYMRRSPDFVMRPLSSVPKWSCFKLPLSAIRMLKQLASSPSSILVSDNDILCAFCWQRISAVRLARGLPGVTPESISRLKLALDGRTSVGVPFSYMGHMVHFATAQLPLGQVVSASLSTIAQILRRNLSATNTEWAFRSYATFIAREPDKSLLMYSGPLNLDTDLGATSTIISMEGSGGASSLSTSFGPLLGDYESSRRPHTIAIPSSITFGALENGAIPIFLGLPDEEVAGLRKDSRWKQFVRYVG